MWEDKFDILKHLAQPIETMIKFYKTFRESYNQKANYQNIKNV